MRHQKHGRKLGRKSAARHALMSNLVASLIEHERIQTTDAKAKELRRLAERTITWATSVGDVVEAREKNGDQLQASDRARLVHAVRMARRVLKQRLVLEKLFDEVGPRLRGRPGGYTRIMKLGYRHGDAAPISIIELVDRAEPAKPEPEKRGGKPAKAEAAPRPEPAKTAKRAEAKAEAKSEPKTAKPTKKAPAKAAVATGEKAAKKSEKTDKKEKAKKETKHAPKKR